MTAVVLSVLFLMLTNLEVANFGLYAAALFAGCCALASTVTFCGALVAQAANRSILAGAIALPMLLPLVALGIGSLKVALGSGALQTGIQSTAGLTLFAVAVFTAGPHLFAAVWKT
jgi:ABC-type transport system involved in cytochrome c biogenesis permease component